MPFPLHYLWQFGGDFVSDPTEIWSNTIRFHPRTGTVGTPTRAMTNAEQTAVALGLRGRIAAHMGTSQSGYSSNVRLKYSKFNLIGADGTYVDKAVSNVSFWPGAGVAGNGASTYPITTSMVVTWRTSAARGPASRGRVFVPHPSVALDGSTYRIAPASLTSMLTQWKTFIDECNGVLDTALEDSAVASVLSNLGTGGEALPIERVEIGDFLDYMGSRRNNLAELRQQSAAITV